MGCIFVGAVGGDLGLLFLFIFGMKMSFKVFFGYLEYLFIFRFFGCFVFNC